MIKSAGVFLVLLTTLTDVWGDAETLTVPPAQVEELRLLIEDEARAIKLRELAAIKHQLAARRTDRS